MLILYLYIKIQLSTFNYYLYYINDRKLNIKNYNAFLTAYKIYIYIF